MAEKRTEEDKRLELQAIFEEVLGSREVYSATRNFKNVISVYKICARIS